MDSPSKLQGYNDALLHTLQAAGVQFLRYQALDAFNTPRVKCVPLSHLLQTQRDHHQRAATGNDDDDNDNNTCVLLAHQVQFATIVLAGLPSFADYMIPESGIDARGTLVLDADFGTLRVLPYAPTAAVVLGTLRELSSQAVSDYCCRSLLQRVVDRAAQSPLNLGFAVGAELEFTLFHANNHKPVCFTNFAHVNLLNQQHDFLAKLRTQLVDKQGIDVALVHKESGPGQVEVVLQHCRNPVTLADRVALARDTIAAVASQHGYKALFLPKLDPMKAGSGCHVHVSLYEGATGRNVFPHHNDDDNSSNEWERVTQGRTGGISAAGQSFVEGILAHLPSLLGLTLPTTNSFRRVGPGCWTGHSVNWSFDDKESPVRVVGTSGGGASSKWNHVEYKLCDHTANLYLALAGLLACGWHGIAQQSRLRPHRFSSSSSGTEEVPSDPLPQSVGDCLDALEQDALLQDTIPPSLLKAYLAVRRAEIARSSKMTLEEEVQEALEFA